MDHLLPLAAFVLAVTFFWLISAEEALEIHVSIRIETAALKRMDERIAKQVEKLERLHSSQI